HRPQPAEETRQLYPGVTYIREVRNQPRPMVIHLIKVDVQAPGVTFFVTPGPPPGEIYMPARQATDFCRQFDVQVAVNGNYFSPTAKFTPLGYYPHSGDLVTMSG